MAATTTIAWAIFISTVSFVACTPNKIASYDYRKICVNVICYKNLNSLENLRNCTIVVGHLHVTSIERTKKKDFANISFPELREVTGYVIIYRVNGLESLGQLFPNLARIRGADLVHDYALIVYDMPDLVEIGLYNLLKVDRGGVIISGGVPTCYLNTINWEAIAKGRRVVPPDQPDHCKVFSACSCSLNPAVNYCWNNKKCQRFIEGPEREKCDSQCFGCKKANATDCTLCQYYTFQGKCFPKCPIGTIVLEINKYCIVEAECNEIGGWSWNNTCIFECPRNYIVMNTLSGKTCRRCDTCEQTCKSIVIKRQDQIEQAKKCVYVNGSITINYRSLTPEVLAELRNTLSIVQVVTDYILINGSISLISLDFLSSLKRIKGNNLFDGKYSLVVYGMKNLQMLFTPSVIKNLQVDNGRLRLYDNPMLCFSQTEELKKKFPEGSEIDIPPQLYSACSEVFLQLRVDVKNETFAVATFNPIPDHNYYILYIRVPNGVNATFVPETCSDSDWNSISVPSSKFKESTIHIDLPSLQPASSYALCVESYNLTGYPLARTSIVNFNTTVGKPEPPFIIELVAHSFEQVVIRWVDHKDYRSHIDYYELDVSIIEISSEDLASKDHCSDDSWIDDSQEFDYSQHAVVLRPPKDYEKGCESTCGVLSTVTAGAMTEDYFDVCNLLESGCDVESNSYNYTRVTNSTFGKYVKSLAINISSSSSDFKVRNLAPYRAYRFELRACIKGSCSRPMSSVVRTLRLKRPDAPRVSFVKVDESSNIDVLWRPPKVTNGPVLAYYIEILPVFSDMEKIMPRTWCVYRNVTKFMVKLSAAKKYFVRICSTTLGSKYVCSKHHRTVFTETRVSTEWWWMGFPFAIVLYMGSLLFGWHAKTNERRNDEISLVDLSSSFRSESEPPRQMLFDSVQLYTVPLRESE